MICLSVVSHGQAPIAAGFLSSLASVKPPLVTRVVYTRNIPEPALAIPDLDPIRFEIIDNAAPHGFGENHNAAFRRCAEPYFCVVNPDILLVEDPFPALVDAFREPALGLAAPLVLSPERQVENTARSLYTPAELLRQKWRPRNRAGSADWLAGMFMLFRSDVYRLIGGFDERYFLYIEDVDICTRLRVAGFGLRQQAGAQVIHAAQKRSHRSLRHAAWHTRSMLRYWATPSFWRYRSMLKQARRMPASPG